jgi:hypothetical protein
MKIKNPLHSGEIRAEWITFALRAGGFIRWSIVRILNKEILRGEAVFRDFRLEVLQLLCFPVQFHFALIGGVGRRTELSKAICSRVFSSPVELDAARSS